MEELDILYKITVLSLLSHSEHTLSGPQISGFFQENDFTDYFKSQFTIGSLMDSGLIAYDEVKGTNHFRLTSEGRKTLALFSDRRSPEIEQDIKDYLKRHNLSIRRAHEVTAFYDREPGGAFLCHMKAMEEKKTVLQCTISVPSQEQAENICLNFKADYEEVYVRLLEMLTR